MSVNLYSKSILLNIDQSFKIIREESVGRNSRNAHTGFYYKAVKEALVGKSIMTHYKVKESFYRVDDVEKMTDTFTLKNGEVTSLYAKYSAGCEWAEVTKWAEVTSRQQEIVGTVSLTESRLSLKRGDSEINLSRISLGESEMSLREWGASVIAVYGEILGIVRWSMWRVSE